MTAATSSAWLQAEAAWFLKMDQAVQPPPGSGVALLAAAAALNAAASSSLDADWSTTHSAVDLWAGPTGPQTALTAVTAMNNAYNAFYSGAGYVSSGVAARLQNDAQQFNAIASRVTSNTVTAADTAWLTTEQNYLNSLDTVLNDSVFGLLVAMEALSSSGMQGDASSNGDSAGAIAVANALTAMGNVWNAVYSRGGGSGPANDALQLQLTVIPDLQTLIPAPYSGPTPGGGGIPIGNVNPALASLARAVLADTTICNGQPNTHVRSFMTAYMTYMSQGGTPPAIYNNTVGSAINAVLGGSLAPACTAITPPPKTITTTSSSMSVTTFLVGVAAIGAVGYLAYHVYRQRYRTPHPALRRNPAYRRRAR